MTNTQIESNPSLEALADDYTARMTNPVLTEDDEKRIGAERIQAGEKLANGKLHKFSDINSELERFLIHFTKREKWAKDVELILVPVDSARQAKCHYARTESWVNSDTGNVVIAMRWSTLWLSDTRDLLAFNLVHELVHGRCGVNSKAHEPNEDNKSPFGAASNGAHNEEFTHAGNKWFSEFVPGDRKDITRNRPVTLSDTAMKRIEAYAWNEAVFTVTRVETVPEARDNKVTSERVTCPKHDDNTVTVRSDNPHPQECAVVTSKADAKSIRKCRQVMVGKSANTDTD